MVQYSHLFKNFSQFVVIHTVKGFDIISKAEVDVFLELSCFFNDPTEHRPVHMVLPSPVSWVPDVRPSSEEETPEKTPPGTAFRPDWETQFTEGKASEPPAEKKRPYCPLEEQAARVCET